MNISINDSHNFCGKRFEGKFKNVLLTEKKFKGKENEVAFVSFLIQISLTTLNSANAERLSKCADLNDCQQKLKDVTMNSQIYQS